MSSRILQDAGILELLNCLRSSNASDSNEQDEAPPNANCPEQRDEEANGRASDDVSLLDWPTFIRQQIPLTSLKVILHAIHSDDWARAATKSQLTGRLLTLSVRFGLGTRVQEPWLLFLYLGQTVPLSLRIVKKLNAWLTANEHIDTNLVLPAITEQSIRRHGRQTQSPYAVFEVDVDRAIQYLDQHHPRSSASVSASVSTPTSSHHQTNGTTPERNEARSDPNNSVDGNVARNGQRVLRPRTFSQRDDTEEQDEHEANSRMRVRRLPRDSSESSAATPEAGRRATHGTSIMTPLGVPDISLRRVESPLMFSLGHSGRQSTDSAGNIGPPGLEARLNALRTLIQFGPAIEITGSDPMAHQTRGLFDSITHLSQLALAAFGQLEQQDHRRSMSSFSNQTSR
ncbi:hypothetical protein LCI18_006372 [Fusarium solani-melongenae]|uniref:Uncharacterized protein n=1 Tax=Fusarium solani subsp. cucurbitae TaxID=2747967 RepID=A0ACD3Z2W6_FUSSC|nr:hypothetical protein LCI18_006372 [Fusarium solani-melongenae]